MCLTSKTKRATTVLKRRRYCWKVVTRGNRSEFRGFQYKVGAKYEEADIDPWWIHLNYNGKRYWNINKGFHSYRNENIALMKRRGKRLIIIRCVMPKGSRVWLGNQGDQVSNKLIYGV